MNSCYRKLDHGACCIKVGNGPLSARLSDVLSYACCEGFSD